MATLTDEERAAKAAKARAQLQKYRKNKASTASPALSVSRPESVTSGLTSPTLSDVAPLPTALTSDLATARSPSPKHAKIASEVPDSLFGSTTASASDDFFSSPALTPSLPPHTEDEPPPKVEEPPTTSAITSPARSTADPHQQTINLLVSEKAQLTQELEQLQTMLDERDTQSQEAISRAEGQAKRLAEVEAALQAEREKASEGAKAQGELQERLAASERQASLATHNAQELRETIESRDDTITSLKAELAADTKLKDVEGRLKAKTTHADTLESEVSKLRTSLNKLKVEKEAVDSEVTTLRAGTTAADQARREHEQAQTALQAELATAKAAVEQAERNATTQLTEIESLRTSSSTGAADLASLRTELTALQRSLTTAQDSLATAESRASQAVSRRDGLQADNDSLVAQVQELREKTVSLTNDHLAAKEKADSLQRTLRERDADLSRSRLAEDEVTARLKQIEGDLAERDRQLTAAKERAERAEHDAQYVQDDAKAREAEIGQLREKVSKSEAEVAKFRTGAEARVTELAAIHSELKAARAEAEREGEERSRLEVDLQQMRDAAAEMQAQIEELKEAREQPSVGSVPPSATAFISPKDATMSNGHVSPIRSETAEMDELRAQHELEVSTLRSQLRDLEGQAFGDSGRAHGLQKETDALRVEVARLEGLVTVEREKALKAMREAFAVGAATSTAPLPSPLRSPPASGLHMLTPSRLGLPSPSPSPSSSAGSRAHRRSRTEAAIQTGSVTASAEYPFPSPTPSPRPPITSSAPPKRASHARRVSLSLLKTRMEDELGLPDIALVSATPETPAYRDHHDETEVGRFSGDYSRPPHSARPRAQLGDDLIWCACCQGDLLVM